MGWRKKLKKYSPSSLHRSVAKTVLKSVDGSESSSSTDSNDAARSEAATKSNNQTRQGGSAQVAYSGDTEEEYAAKGGM